MDTLPAGTDVIAIAGVEPELADLVRRLTPEFCGRPLAPDDPAFWRYAGRLRACLAYHAEQIDPRRRLPLGKLIDRVERGEPAQATSRRNVLRDVALAQALELGESRAAEAFDAELMPVVGRIAMSLGGDRAVDNVENFAADLMLPREGRPPRIASYQGRTTLALWLGPVVANAWRSEARRKRPESLAVLPEPRSPEDRADLFDGLPCEALLRPIFAGTCLSICAEDRLLIKLLLLDGVPQKDLARSLGLNSGTITRRRQRTTEAILSNVRDQAARCDDPGRARDCLQSMLAGEDPELSRRLAEIMADGLRGVSTPGRGEGR